MKTQIRRSLNNLRSNNLKQPTYWPDLIQDFGKDSTNLEWAGLHCGILLCLWRARSENQQTIRRAILLDQLHISHQVDVSRKVVLEIMHSSNSYIFSQKWLKTCEIGLLFKIPRFTAILILAYIFDDFRFITYPHLSEQVVSLTKNSQNIHFQTMAP